MAEAAGEAGTQAPARRGASPGVRLLAPRARTFHINPLIPLVDIVFLLLTFFMLSSNLSPFGLLPLDATARRLPDGSPAAGRAAASDLLISVDAGRVRLNGTVVDAKRLDAALVRAREGGASRATILTAKDARVQDLVTALDAARAAAFASVAIVEFR